MQALPLCLSAPNVLCISHFLTFFQVAEAKSKAEEAKGKAQAALDKATATKNKVERSNNHLRDLIKQIRDFLTRESRPPAGFKHSHMFETGS